LIGELHIEAQIIKIDDLAEILGCAVVEIRRAGRETSQNLTLPAAVEIAAFAGDEGLS
jgi:hypothetical protein